MAVSSTDGFSLEGEYFLRWLDHFHGPGTAGLASIFSHGFQLQASAMVLPKTLQAYLGGSTYLLASMAILGIFEPG